MTNTIDKLKRLFRRSSQATAVATIGLATLATETAAQADGRKITGIDGVDSYELQEDGSLLVILENGEVLTLPAGEFSLVGGEVVLTQTGFDTILIALADGVDEAAAYWAALAATGGVGAFSLAEGDSDSSGDDADPVDPGDTVAPVITSEPTATVAENVATDTIVYQTVATDETATSLTYSLSGPDADLFAIDPDTGAVTFNASPDHEAPSMQGGSRSMPIRAK